MVSRNPLRIKERQWTGRSGDMQLGVIYLSRCFGGIHLQHYRRGEGGSRK